MATRSWARHPGAQLERWQPHPPVQGSPARWQARALEREPTQPGPKAPLERVVTVGLPPAKEPPEPRPVAGRAPEP